MTKSFNEKLIQLLKTDARFVDDEGELVKAAVIDRAWKIDRDLVKLLLGKPEIKDKFFEEIEGHWIFNINIFIEYVADKNFLANSYTRFRNKIGLNIDGKFLRERGEVSLVWPYKDCVLEGGQAKEEEKRKEIFFNEILAQDEIDRLFDPKALTGWKRYTVDGEQKVTDIKRDENGTIRENLIIKGNNLLALHTLKKQFRGKVKLIYIDPPYNTGNDEFNYNDSFNHSSWLTFMKNRLEVAKELLTNTGAIFVQISDIEYAYLKILMDEIFGKECFQSSICVKMAHLSGPKMAHKDKKIPKVKEYILMYSKKETGLSLVPQYAQVSWEEAFDRYEAFIDNSGNDSDYEEWKPISLIQALKKHGIEPNDGIAALKFKMENAGKIYQTAINRSKKYPKEPKNKFIKIDDKFVLNGRELIFASEKIREFNGIKKPSSIISDIWTDIGINNVFQEGGKEISLRFGKKPEMLLKRIISMLTEEGDIVLDFFLGTGTTCAVAHKMQRQYLGIEQIEYGESDSVNRLNNVINGDQSGISNEVGWKSGGQFIYSELMKYNEAFIGKIQAAKSSKELINLWKDIAENSFLNWYVNPEMPEEAVNDFIEIGKSENGQDKQKKLLVELLNKNQLYVNFSEIDDADFNVSDEDKKLNQSFYGENA